MWIVVLQVLVSEAYMCTFNLFKSLLKMVAVILVE